MAAICGWCDLRQDCGFRRRAASLADDELRAPDQLTLTGRGPIFAAQVGGWRLDQPRPAHRCRPRDEKVEFERPSPYPCKFGFEAGKGEISASPQSFDG
jgi:hypothetical protein